MQKLSWIVISTETMCDLLTVKPEGFVTPVTPAE
jgi:hypothetical protein